MKKYDSLKDALRAVKDWANDMDSIHESVYVMADHYGENFYVTDDRDDLSSYLTDRFYENCADWNPEDWAKEHVIYKYTHFENKEKYPNVFSEYKKSLIKAAVPLIRGKKSSEPEYSVDFVIN